MAGTLAFVGWQAFSYDHPVRSRKVVATYLCAVSFQLVHMAEEYTGGFPHEIGHLVLSALLLGLLVQESRRLRARPSWSRRRPPAPARPRTSRAS